MAARLSVLDGQGQSLLAELGPDEVAKGSHEGSTYVLQCHPSPQRLYVDDVLIPPSKTGGYEWTPGFFAGMATVSVDLAASHTAEFLLSVSPPTSKATDAQLLAMVEAVREFDVNLLVGDSAGKMGFGKEEMHDAFAALVQIQRMRRYGPQFVQALRRLAKTPHQSFVSESQWVPLTRVRQLSPDSLKDRRVAALLVSSQLDVEELESTQVRSRNPVRSVDTPANRTLTALLRRVKARNHSLLESLQQGLPGDPTENLARQPRREEALLGLSGSLLGISLKEPFNAFKGQVQTSAAGLTQIAASPLYQQAYRLGSLALATGLKGEQLDALSVNYSWGIYETWCLFAVLTACGVATGSQFRRTHSTWVTSDVCYEFEVTSSRRLQVHFQAKFPALSPLKGKACWSISRERYPDILVLDIHDESARSLVLDAKWRSGRTNLLEAMESAHLYHDALRIQGKQPGLCLLLAPGLSDVPEIASDQYLTANRVGVIYECLPDGNGQSRLQALINDWFFVSSHPDGQKQMESRA